MRKINMNNKHLNQMKIYLYIFQSFYNFVDIFIIILAFLYEYFKEQK